MVWSRRAALRLGLGALALGPRSLEALWIEQGQRTRPIPSSGEELPVVGLGSARTFSSRRAGAETDALREVLRLFHSAGGRVFDTAPTYGGAEEVSGRLAQDLDIHRDLFFATKISTGGGVSAGRAQDSGSREAWGRDIIDLSQVHNLRGVDVHLPFLRDLKDAGRIRYVGITTSRIPQHDATEAILAREEMDFVQINYSLGERQAAGRLIPLAQDRGVAVLVNEPFNAGRLFGAVRGRSVPAWAAEFDCDSWGQFFLKYILGHPGVTVVIPATGDPEHLVDNMGAGLGRLPDAGQRRRMESFFDAL
ncbi:MAG: aldo/keto reductase [Gemmatimonadetes bacterium]|nr:aldo/keto reductase [Gemmatimonadota bacterium]